MRLPWCNPQERKVVELHLPPFPFLNLTIDTRKMNRFLLTPLFAALVGMVEAQPASNVWSQIGDGVNGSVYTVLKGGGDTLVVVGNFTDSGITPANNIALWNGNAFEALGDGVYGDITCAAIIGHDIYVGGSGLSTAYTDIAKWDGAEWSYSTAFDGNFPQVNTLFVHNDTLYAGGIVSGFIGSDDVVKRLDNGSWTTLGSALNNIVRTLGWHDGQLVVGGDFTALQNGGGTNLNHVARLNGGDWGPLASGLPDPVNELLDVNGTLYAAGNIRMNGSYRFGLARFPENGTAWEELMENAANYINTGNSDDASIFALDHDGTSLYIGGDFAINTGTVTGSHVARFEGVADGFTPYANLNSLVSSLTHNSQMGLVAGGLFTENGTTYVNHVGHSDLTTGIRNDPSLMLEMGLSPNPATDQLTVSLSRSASGPAQAVVLALDGRIVAGPFGVNAGRTAVNVAGLANGLYMVRVTGEHAQRTLPFIKY